MKIGLIGLGNMGGAIAERLLKQGVELYVCDLDREACERARAQGAVICAMPGDVADRAPTVIGCLPTVRAVEAVLNGPGGVLQGQAISYYVEMSTIGPASAAQHAEQAEGRCSYIDAAISGGSGAAAAGQLVIMLAGAPDALAELTPLVDMLSSRHFVVGDKPGQAQAMKLVNNLLAAANMANSFEALTLGVAMGLRPETIVEVVNVSSGQNTGLVERRVKAILSRRFDSGPKIDLLVKDIDLAFKQAAAIDFPVGALPSLSGMAELWNRAAANGMGTDDVSALIRLVEDAANVEVAGTDQAEAVDE